MTRWSWLWAIALCLWLSVSRVAIAQTVPFAPNWGHLFTSLSLPLAMTGKLTTHVLDTANGQPAAGMTISLWAVAPTTGEKTKLKTVTTNADGRTDGPLLTAEEFQVGVYELVFQVGDYFAARSPARPQPAFLNQVPIQFGIADPEAHYHVPLLVSPWAYSTYRGS